MTYDNISTHRGNLVWNSNVYRGYHDKEVYHSEKKV